MTYADVWEFWAQFPQVAAHVDVVTIHLLPYWEDTPTGIDRAVEHVGAVYRRMTALFPGRPVAIGETGWPSRGRQRADAVPSVVNQAVFLRRFIALSQADGFDYNLIEAFDQGWKYQNEGVVGANWGLLDAARVPKFPRQGGVVEDRAWPAGALFSCLLFVALLAGAMRPGLSRGAEVALAAIAACLGGALGFAQHAVGARAVRHGRAGRRRRQPRRAECAGGAGDAPGRGPAGRRDDAARAHRGGGDRPGARRAAAAPRPPAAGRRRGVRRPFVRLPVDGSAVLQLLLLFDPRYRRLSDAPCFAVPLVVTGARLLLGDLPREGGGRAEAWAGGVLAAAGTHGSAARGAGRTAMSLAWSACALMLAAPALAPLPSRMIQAQAPRTRPSIPPRSRL